MKLRNGPYEDVDAPYKAFIFRGINIYLLPIKTIVGQSEPIYGQGHRY